MTTKKSDERSNVIAFPRTLTTEELAAAQGFDVARDVQFVSPPCIGHAGKLGVPKTCRHGVAALADCIRCELNRFVNEGEYLPPRLQGRIRYVTIPARAEHEGLYSMTVPLLWECPECSGPRGETFKTVSFDGSRALHCDGWRNPCGHLDSYPAMRREAGRE